MNARREEEIQLTLCRYVAHKYPKALFNSDMSGFKLTPGQAAKAKKMRSTNGFPDWVMYETIDFKETWMGANIEYQLYGLFLELKKENEKLQKRNGEWKPHPGKQWETIQKLRERGFAAGFAIGLDNAMAAVDAYMNGDFNKLNNSFYKPIDN